MRIGTKVNIIKGVEAGHRYISDSSLPQPYLFYAKAPNATGTDAGKWILSESCFTAVGEGIFFTSAGVPIAVSGATILAAMGYEWSWQFSLTKGLTVYALTASTETINKARRYHKLDRIYPALAWSYRDGLTSKYGPNAAFASAGVTPDGLGGVLAQNSLPVHGDSGVYVGPGYTNKIANPLCVGAVAGTPGTVPTGWVKTTTAGVSTKVVNSGVGYVDINVYGTASGVATIIIAGPTTTSSVVASVGQAWTASVNVSLVSGEFPTGKVDLWCSERISDGSSIGSTRTIVGVNANGADTSVSRTLTEPTVARVWSPIALTTVNGTTYDFTIRISKPQLTQTAYKMPFVGPPAGTIAETTVTSCVGTSGSNGLGFAMDEGMLECLRGETDEVEMWNNASAVGANWALADGKWTHTPGATVSLNIDGAVTIGDRYLIKVAALGITAGSVTPGVGQTYATAITANEVYQFELIATTDTRIRFTPSSTFAGSLSSNISIQKLLPSRCTVAALVKMGVGSAELPNGIDIGVVTPRNVEYILLCTKRAGWSTPYLSSSSDGSIDSLLEGSWSANELHLKIVQTNSAGTKFRVGNKRLGIDAAIQWLGWEDYDGSFNPLTHLRAAFTGTVPMHLKNIQTWDRPVPDATITDWAEARL